MSGDHKHHIHSKTTTVDSPIRYPITQLSGTYTEEVVLLEVAPLLPWSTHAGTAGVGTTW